MDNYNILLGENIKKIRKQKGLTQEKLAECVNRSKNHISKIEQGSANPPIALIYSIASVLDVHPKILFEFEDSPSCKLNKNDLKQELYQITNKKHLKLLYNIYKLLLDEPICKVLED